MITVTVDRKQLILSGHAGYGEAGTDIVCAAVSCLTWNLARGLEVLTGDGIRYQGKEGEAEFNLENLSEAGKLLVDSFFIGMCDIAENYPDCVTIN